MALIAIAAVQVAFDVGLMIYRLLNRPQQALPPLRDLQIMTSTNGAPIPFGYGTVRVAGNVIWTSGMIVETQGDHNNIIRAPWHILNGANGTPLFFINLAVAFGEGPGIISRIWADSKLIYDVNPAQSNAVPASDWPAWISTELYNPGNQVGYLGQVWQCLATNTNSAPSSGNRNWEDVSAYPPWDSSTEYAPGDTVTYGSQLYVAQLASNNGVVGPVDPTSSTYVTVAGQNNVGYWMELDVLYEPPTIYPGDENQLPDSIIQASEGVTLTPAFRGLIYAVFENIWLGNFANRIPSLRAEVTYTKVGNLA